MMDVLEALRAAVRHDDPAAPGRLRKPDVPDLEYAVWRFLEAWRWQRARGGPEFGADGAVLLRQVARWAPGELHLPPLPAVWRPWLARAGLEHSATGVLAAG